MTKHSKYADYLNIPVEIYDFFIDVFDLMEIRGNVGDQDGIQFLIRTNELNHALPHVHAKYGEYEISIAIGTAAILAGNLPKKQEKKAQQWVIRNEEKLLTNWNKIALNACMPFHKSNLGS